jgi:EAL domain-containing protein (putative c-di-GMP-specific phosphodiesterase class I)
VRISIDDFGTGYSSLSYLKRIPAGTIKIDKSFVDGLCHGAEDTAIVHTVVALANALEKETIAEGIETREQFDAIRDMGCGFAQGYWISVPLGADALTTLLAQGTQLVSPSNNLSGQSGM